MRLLKNLLSRIRRIPRRVYVLLAGLLLTLAIAAGGTVFGWEYANSTGFCGTTCHLMDPQYRTYLASSHSRVACVECHLGRSAIATTALRKAGDLKELWSFLTHSYETPIVATTLLPSRESCEKCHSMSGLPDNRVVDIRHYDDKAPNMVDSTLLVMKTGSVGSPGTGPFGIHWHTASEIWFAATDPLKQDIPWVQVIDAQGNTTTYTDGGKEITPAELASAGKTRMDCVDCHNRIAHNFRSPGELLDQALSTGRVNPNIPFIRQKGIEFFQDEYRTADEADQALATLESYYRKQFAGYYDKNKASIQSSLAVLKQMYLDVVFPEFETNWTSHPDNLGHKESAGCFRCHDGKHLTADKSQAIRIECNLCHTEPQTGRPGRALVINPTNSSAQPESHTTPTWLTDHSRIFDATCQQCHDVRNAGGTDNSSFCANGACHGTAWTYAGLNAPQQAGKLVTPVPGAKLAAPSKLLHAVGGVPECQACHAGKTAVLPYPSDHVNLPNDRCTTCHQPAR